MVAQKFVVAPLPALAPIMRVVALTLVKACVVALTLVKASVVAKAYS